jgi:hypothetical protein
MNTSQQLENAQITIGAMGSKLDRAEDMDLKVIAKLIRKEFKQAFPLVKTSVKTSYYSGGCSLNVEIVSIPEDFVLFTNDFMDYARNGYDGGFDGKSRYEAEAQNILTSMRAIGDQYRYDNGNQNTDLSNTNFFNFVKFGVVLCDARTEQQLAGVSK